MLFSGIQLTNGVVSSLIIGCIPLTITLFSKPNFNGRFFLGLGFILMGMGFLLLVPIWKDGIDGSIHSSGILLLFGALTLWTWFGISNAKFLHARPHIKSLDYSSTMGLMSLLAVLPIFLLINDFSSFMQHPKFTAYLLWSAVLGIGASWVSNVLWMYASKNCSRSILGSLLISETLFALLYSFIYAWRLPYWNELAAVVSLVLGVVCVVNSQA